MIVITGASDGLGKELATVYKAAGRRVINLARTENPEVENVTLDLTDPESIDSAISQLSALEEPIEILVNCAGVMSLEPVNGITAEEIERVFRTNIMGAMQLTSGLIERIRAANGDIVNVASTVGTKAYEDQAAYGASKWAMRGFSQNLQLELKNSGVRVISFCVGGFQSRIGEKVGKQRVSPEEWMNPRDVAVFVKQMLDLPKNMEVTEIVLNRKTV